MILIQSNQPRIMVLMVPPKIKSNSKNLKNMQKVKNLMIAIGATTSRMNKNKPIMKSRWSRQFGLR